MARTTTSFISVTDLRMSRSSTALSGCQQYIRTVNLFITQVTALDGLAPERYLGDDIINSSGR